MPRLRYSMSTQGPVTRWWSESESVSRTEAAMIRLPWAMTSPGTDDFEAQRVIRFERFSCQYR